MRKLLSSLFILLLVAMSAIAQERTVTGTVTDKEDGAPLPGVSVRVKGTVSGTQTGPDGKFSIHLPDGSNTLTFTYVGYATRDVIAGTSNVVNVVLVSSLNQLSEIVVTGYQTKTRADVSSSISVVNGKELAEKPVPTIDNLLQGKAAGVQVTAINGKPGGNAFIRIRGTGSVNAGNEPLLVVDGVQVPDNMADQFYSTLNANDILSVSVLKDAAGVSLYGARGSNGVVVITTKNGSESGNYISYSFQYGNNEKIPDNFHLMTPAQKLQYEYDLGYENSDFSNYLQNSDFPSTATLFNITDAQRQEVWDTLIVHSHDWRNDILQKGKIMQHQLAIGGHSGKTNYYLSFQKFDQGGLTVGSAYKRYTGKLNLSSEVKPWLTISNNLSLGQSKSNELRDIYNAQNPFYAAYAYNPYEPVFSSDGSYNLTSQGLPILEALRNNPELQKYLNGYNSTIVDVHPAKGLNVSTQIGLTYNDYNREAFIKPGSILDQYIGDPSAPGSKTDNGSTEFAYDWINKAIYKFTIAGDHHFNVLAAQEFQKDQFSSYQLEKKGFASGDLSTQDNGAANDGTNTTAKSAWTLASLLGELDYNFKDKYFATGSFRRDGSSRFGENNKYGNFYSASASWLITGEEFMKQYTWLNVLKLRGSIGTAGNFNIGNYQSLGTFGFGKYNNALTAFPTRVANPDLTWEKKIKRDIGLDFEFLHSRIAASVDYYNENTQSLLFDVPLSMTTGFSSVTKNAGAVSNKGFDIALSIDAIRSKDLTWTLYGNINANKNRVTKLYGGADEINSNGLSVFKAGYAYGTYKLVRYAGVDPQTGDAQYYDKDGNITKDYSADDAVVLKGKSPNPKAFGGFGTSLTYKGVNLSADFVYSSGNYTFNYNKEVLVSWGDEVYYNQSDQALNYWKNPGDVNVLPKPSASNVTYDTDLYLQNASYVRLRNVTLSYTLPKAITQRFKVQSLRVYGTGQNLLTFTNFFGDPEVGYGSEESDLTQLGQAILFSYPQTRQYTFGLDVTF